jgi:hypothetical protein
MKTLLLLALVLFCSETILAQSIEITPQRSTLLSDVGDNLNINSSSSVLGVYGYRFNGTINSKTPVVIGNALFTIGAGGYQSPSSSTFDKGKITFSATQNWDFSNNGTKIQFFTTQNSTTTQLERMVIDHNGNIGIGNTSPTAKLHINHFASAGSPTLHLQSNGNVSSIIRATSTVAGSEWNNHFVNGSVPGTNLVYWVTGAGVTPLILTGTGDAIIENKAIINGFTKLGNEISSPSIKMKEITGTTNAVSFLKEIDHGLTQSKILAISIFINDTYGSDIPPGLSLLGAARYEYYLMPSQIRLVSDTGNDTQIRNRPFRVLITYKE